MPTGSARRKPAARSRRIGRRCLALLAGATAIGQLQFAGPALGGVITADNLPVLNQHKAVYDGNPNDGNQNGDYWCVPVAAVSALLWLADHYNRPRLIPMRNNQPYTTDEFVKWLASGRYFNTSDTTGTAERRIVAGLWAYLQTTPYKWQMDVFENIAGFPEIPGVNYQAHATVSDLYQAMAGFEHMLPSAVLMSYATPDPLGGPDIKHEVVLQQISDAIVNNLYPATIMNPERGQLLQVDFEATNQLETPAKIFDNGPRHDVYLAVAIHPAPEPGTIVLFWTGVLGMIAMKCSHKYRRQLVCSRLRT